MNSTIAHIITRALDDILIGDREIARLLEVDDASDETVTYARMATIVSVVSLATGSAVPGNCTHESNQLAVFSGANLLWSEVGSNPRDIEAETVCGWTGERCRELYGDCGWEVLEGPSQLFVR